MNLNYPIKETKEKMSFKRVIIFDEDCGFCSRWVTFVLKRDIKGQFQYASLQGQFTKSLYQTHPELLHLNTVFYLREGVIWVKSNAVLHILKDLGGGWSWLYFFKWLPPLIRDLVYDIMAKYRYNLFGKSSCPIPKASHRERFID